MLTVAWDMLVDAREEDGGCTRHSPFMKVLHHLLNRLHPFYGEIVIIFPAPEAHWFDNPFSACFAKLPTRRCCSCAELCPFLY